VLVAEGKPLVALGTSCLRLALGHRLVDPQTSAFEGSAGIFGSIRERWSCASKGAATFAEITIRFCGTERRLPEGGPDVGDERVGAFAQLMMGRQGLSGALDHDLPARIFIPRLYHQPGRAAAAL
jgi:hypothetical protein